MRVSRVCCSLHACHHLNVLDNFDHSLICLGALPCLRHHQQPYMFLPGRHLVIQTGLMMSAFNLSFVRSDFDAA